MRKYEAVCVFNPKTKEEKVDEIISRIEKKIKEKGGQIDKIDKQGVRKLPYIFQRHKDAADAYYLIIFFSGTGNLPNEITSNLRLIEDIMRFSVIQSKGEEAERVEVELPGAEKEEKVESAPA